MPSSPVELLGAVRRFVEARDGRVQELVWEAEMVTMAWHEPSCDAIVDLARDLHDFVEQYAVSFSGRSFHCYLKPGPEHAIGIAIFGLRDREVGAFGL